MRGLRLNWDKTPYNLNPLNVMDVEVTFTLTPSEILCNELDIQASAVGFYAGTDWVKETKYTIPIHLDSETMARVREGLSSPKKKTRYRPNPITRVKLLNALCRER